MGQRWRKQLFVVNLNEKSPPAQLWLFVYGHRTSEMNFSCKLFDGRRRYRIVQLTESNIAPRPINKETWVYETCTHVLGYTMAWKFSQYNLDRNENRLYSYANTFIIAR